MEHITEGNLAMLGSILGAAVLFLIRMFFKDSSERAEQNFGLGVNIAYQIVNEIALRTKTPIDDKVALGLKYLRDFLSTKGQELTPVDEQRAKLLFQAMHGADLAGKK